MTATTTIDQLINGNATFGTPPLHEASLPTRHSPAIQPLNDLPYKEALGRYPEIQHLRVLPDNGEFLADIAQCFKSEVSLVLVRSPVSPRRATAHATVCLSLYACNPSPNTSFAEALYGLLKPVATMLEHRESLMCPEEYALKSKRTFNTAVNKVVSYELRDVISTAVSKAQIFRDRLVVLPQGSPSLAGAIAARAYPIVITDNRAVDCLDPQAHILLQEQRLTDGEIKQLLLQISKLAAKIPARCATLSRPEDRVPMPNTRTVIPTSPAEKISPLSAKTATAAPPMNEERYQALLLECRARGVVK